MGSTLCLASLTYFGIETPGIAFSQVYFHGYKGGDTLPFHRSSATSKNEP